MKFTVKCIPLAPTLPESSVFPKCAKLVSRVCPALSSCSLLNGYFQLQVCEVFLPFWFHSSYNNRAHRILSLSSVKSPILLLMVNLWSPTMRKVYSSTYRSENLLKKNRGCSSRCCGLSKFTYIITQWAHKWTDGLCHWRS